LVWKPTFVLPFGLKTKFHITVRPAGTGFHIITVPGPAAAEENLGFTCSGYFFFLTEKVSFISPFGLEANLHITVWSDVQISY
jgi:hypothetical protein